MGFKYLPNDVVAFAVEGAFNIRISMSFKLNFPLNINLLKISKIL